MCHPVTWLPALCLLVALPLGAAQLTFESTPERVTLLELYTSEGCSSCPPADRWLSGLREDPRLWREVVPVAFHVDYWDGIGWPDRFATAEFSQRQRSYANAGYTGSVYTPGFVVDGREWRGWFRGGEPDIGGGAPAGVLVLEVSDARIDARYRPSADVDPSAALELHVAWLGFGLRTEVRAGENAGRTLEHDFVVLDHRRIGLRQEGNAHRAGFVADRPDDGAARLALAAWVTKRGDPAPLQAVGGWLEARPGS